MAVKDPLSMVFAALADPTRRQILTRLSEGSATVGQLAEPFEMSAPAISQHLKVLERAGLVARTASAQWRTLSLRPEPLEQASEWVERHRREWNQRFDALDEHLTDMKARTSTTSEQPPQKRPMPEEPEEESP